jgi:hypothetical protein
MSWVHQLTARLFTLWNGQLKLGREVQIDPRTFITCGGHPRSACGGSEPEIERCKGIVLLLANMIMGRIAYRQPGRVVLECPHIIVGMSFLVLAVGRSGWVVSNATHSMGAAAQIAATGLAVTSMWLLLGWYRFPEGCAGLLTPPKKQAREGAATP